MQEIRESSATRGFLQEQLGKAQGMAEAQGKIQGIDEAQTRDTENKGA